MLEVEAVGTSETLINFYQTSWHHILENKYLQTSEIFSMTIGRSVYRLSDEDAMTCVRSVKTIMMDKLTCLIVGYNQDGYI
jgi:hypothetical protein